MIKIELQSRYDIFNINPDILPDDTLYAVGKDGWFITSKEYLQQHKKVFEKLQLDSEHRMMFGTERKVK